MYESIVLPYSYDALEPFLSARTINIHFNKHYKNYLNKLNQLLQGVGYDYRYSKEELIDHIDQFPMEIRDDILFNLGGVINHELYFLGLGVKNNLPFGNFGAKLIKQYGSFDNFKKQFIQIASKAVGSSYTFLVVNKNKDLDILNTSNQDTPYLYGFIPILALDLWEHAYYLDYQSNKSAYIDAFFQNIDFSNVERLYDQAIQKITK